MLWETTLVGNEFHWDAVLGKKRIQKLRWSTLNWFGFQWGHDCFFVNNFIHIAEPSLGTPLIAKEGTFALEREACYSPKTSPSYRFLAQISGSFQVVLCPWWNRDPKLSTVLQVGANEEYYRMARNFWGSQFLRFSPLTGNPRKLNPWNRKPKCTMLTCVITGGVAIVVHITAASI